MNLPRITPEQIEDNIFSEHFFTAGDGIREAATVADPWVPETCELLTLCVLVLRNGFTVVGKSACVSPELFNKETGERYAREDAFRQCWPLMGYALKDRLWRDSEDALQFHKATT